MFCNKCGTKIKGTPNFCPKCGAVLKQKPSNNAAGVKKKSILPPLMLLLALLVLVAGGVFVGVRYFKGTAKGGNRSNAGGWSTVDKRNKDEEGADEESDSEASTLEMVTETSEAVMGVEPSTATVTMMSEPSATITTAAPTSSEPMIGAETTAVSETVAWAANQTVPDIQETQSAVLSPLEDPEGMILVDSSSRALTAADLNGLTKDELRLARNEIYARHGRKFNDAVLQSYFDSKTWYRGIINPDSFNDMSLLSELERKNLDFIKSKEATMN